MSKRARNAPPVNPLDDPMAMVRADTNIPFVAKEYIRAIGYGKFQTGLLMLLDHYDPRWRQWIPDPQRRKVA